MVLNDELRGDRRAEAQRERRGPVQLVIRERAYRGGRLTTVPAQEFDRGGLRYPNLVMGVPGVQLGDNLPRDVHNGLAAGDCSREINLDRIDAGDVAHDDADRTAVTSRHRRAPFRLRDSFSEGSQGGGAFLNPISQ